MTPAFSQTFLPYAGQPGGRTETVEVEVAPGPEGRRQFTLRSTQVQRDASPQTRVVLEHPGAPTTTTGSALFDALFAMAVDDARLNSVAEIRDAAYDGGQPIPCVCYQTGEKWHYVWTRDLSYAAHLGLSWLDPERVATSLRFKVSGFRPGTVAPAGLPADSLQIIQDTGSGGSWPVSTDRVTWAWGAEAALLALPPEQAGALADTAYRALRGTLEADRLAAFDAGSGLYGGEQSFLDWRTQSYAPWIVNNLSRMAASKSLSTNVGHYQALSLAARLARERGDAALAARYLGWADGLKAAINRVFWLDDVQQYASLTTDDEVPLALHRYDLLGTALAVISGVAPPDRAAAALARYPHAPFGAPVLSPQLPGVPVYHNRALWPFVTAYALRAAAVVGNSAVAAQAFESLQRGAALNLSNMENLEWLTGLPQFDDGPVINSRRQLWSVGAYLALVVEGVFGLHATADGLRVALFLTTTARRALGAGDRALLAGLPLRGQPLAVHLVLPPATALEGYHPLAGLRLDGEPVDALIPWARLGAGPHTLELRFGPVLSGDTRITRLAAVAARDREDPRAFSPPTPALEVRSRQEGGLVLGLAAPRSGTARTLSFRLSRDGLPLAGPGLDTAGLTLLAPLSRARHTYAVEATDLSSGLQSHSSEPLVVEGEATQQLRLGDEFALSQDGRYGVELVYDNRAGSIETGITNAVKVLTILDAQGAKVARGVVQMPHLDGGRTRGLSTTMRAWLAAGRYRVELLDFFNMSYLAANARYAGAGGRLGPSNEAAVEQLRVFALPALPERP
jgi:hypothetical protein